MSARLLGVLLEEAPGLLRHEELLGRVWGRQAVTPGVFSQSIREIRQALGDSPREPRFIETRYRLGYCFIAPVHVEAAETASAEPAVPERSSTAVSTPKPEAIPPAVTSSRRSPCDAPQRSGLHCCSRFSSSAGSACAIRARVPRRSRPRLRARRSNRRRANGTAAGSRQSGQGTSRERRTGWSAAARASRRPRRRSRQWPRCGTGAGSRRPSCGFPLVGRSGRCGPGCGAVVPGSPGGKHASGGERDGCRQACWPVSSIAGKAGAGQVAGVGTRSERLTFDAARYIIRA